MQNESRLMNAKAVCAYLNLGRNRGVKFAKSIGSEVAIGRRRLYDRVVIDRYLDQRAQEQEFRLVGLESIHRNSLQMSKKRNGEQA